MARRDQSPLGWTEDMPLDIRYRGYGGGPTGRGNLAAQSSLTRVIDPPMREKLLSSQDFNAEDYALILAAGAGSQVQGPSFTLPETMVGWLQLVWFYVLTPTANTSVSFAVRINGGPVSGFDNQQNPPGVANFVILPFNDLRVRIPNGATVDVLVTNLNANGPWTVGAKLGGWYHALSDEMRVYGEAGQ